MKEYFKQYWKWLCISLVLPVLLIILGLFMNNDPLGDIEVYAIVALLFLIPIFLIWLVIGIFRKSLKVPVTLLLISCLTIIFTYGYSQILGPQHYVENGKIYVNGVQRQKLNTGAKKIKQIDHAIDSNNHSETENAKSNAKYLNDYISKYSNSNSLRSLSSYSYKTLKHDLGNSSFDSDETADSNALRNLAINYGQTVLKQHNTENEMINDNGKSLRKFMNIVNL